MRIKSPVFVGRRSELERLTGWLAAAREGRPQVVVIGGEAGIGKSRLVAESVRLAESQAMRVLSGAAADYGEGGLPFGAVAEALRPVLQPAEISAGNDAGALPGLLPHQSPFERLLRQLERLAAEQPILLVLEDLHWADASTREFLAFLSRNLGSSRQLVLGTYRSDDLTRGHPLRRYLAELERAGRIERMELQRFGPRESRQQLEAIRGGEIEPDELARLYERSEGNPFFAEEVFAAQQLRGERTSLPASLRDILLARLERLQPGTRTALAAAAVAGRADDEFLAAVTDLSHDEVLLAQREAIDQYLLEPIADPPALGYAFRHALLREAIYEDLLAGERSRLHERVARAMTASLDQARTGRPADPQLLSRLAHHWQEAGRFEEAFVASWRAADAAERSLAAPEAARHFARVLELWPQVAQPEALLASELGRDGRVGPAGGGAAPADRATVAWRAAEAAGMSGDLRSQVRLLRVALEGMEAGADAERLALLRIRLMEALADRGEGDAARREHALALVLVPEIGSAEVRARVLLALSHHLIVDDYETLRELSTRALAAARQAGSVDAEAAALVKIGRHMSFAGRVSEGMEHFAAARSLAEANGLDAVVAWAEMERAVILECAARFEEALLALEAMGAIVSRLGDQRSTRHNRAMTGQALHRLARWAESETALGQALEPPADEWAWVLRGYLYAGMGRLAEARADLARAWEAVEGSNSSASFGPYYSALAEIAIWEGRPEEGLQVTEQGLGSPLDTRWLGELYRLQLRALADLGEAVAAARAFDDFRTRAEEELSYGSIYGAELRAALLTCEAELARATGKGTAAAWQAAADGWAELKEAYPEAYALFRLGEVHLMAGRTGLRAAGTALARAADLCRAMHAEPLLAMVLSLARRAGLEPRAAVSGDDYGLTAREREVLVMLAAGSTDRQIADALFISPKTASVHVSNIKGKLGVERRIEAAAVALRLGLTEGPAAAKLRPVEETGR